MIRSQFLCCFVLLLSASLSGQAAPTAQPSTPRLENPDYRPTLTDPGSGNVTGMTQVEIDAAKTMMARMDSWSSRLNQPAGISIELRELRRVTQEDKTVITYALFGSNVPKDKTYMLGRWPLGDGEKLVLKGLTFNDQGRAVCPGTPGNCGDPKKPNQPIELPVTAGRMEAIRFAILSEDKSVRAYANAIPYPNAVSDKNCRIEAVLGVPNRELVMVQGSGFTPSEPLKLTQNDPPREQEIRADADGTIAVGILHPADGNNSGNVTVKVSGASCAPELTYDWGPAAYQKVKAGLQ